MKHLHLRLCTLGIALLAIVVDSPSSLAQDIVQVKKKLVSAHAEITERVARWEAEVDLLQKQLNRSDSATDRMLGLHLTRAIDDVRKECTPRLLVIREMLKTANFENLNDLQLLNSYSEAVACALAAGHLALTDDIGPHAQRLGWEQTLKDALECTREQSELEGMQLRGELRIKAQLAIRRKTESVLTLIRSAGIGTGNVGKLLENAASNLQAAIKSQMDVEERTKRREGNSQANLNAQRELSLATDRIREIVDTARVLEQTASLARLNHKIAATRKSLLEIEAGARDLRQAIDKNKEKRLTRENKMACLFLSYHVKDAKSELKKATSGADGLMKFGHLLNVLQFICLDFDAMIKRFEAYEIDQKTFVEMKQLDRKLELAEKAGRQMHDLLGSLNTGELSEPIFRKQGELAHSLAEMLKRQRQFSKEIEEQRRSMIGGPLRPLLKGANPK